MVDCHCHMRGERGGGEKAWSIAARGMNNVLSWKAVHE